MYSINKSIIIICHVLFKKRAGVQLEILNLIIPTTSFLNGFKISDVDPLILALICRFGVTFV